MSRVPRCLREEDSPDFPCHEHRTIQPGYEISARTGRLEIGEFSEQDDSSPQSVDRNSFAFW